MKTYYVYFNKNGQEVCHCFESKQEEAEHFAKIVGGRIVVE